jgi:hypothetical protein
MMQVGIESSSLDNHAALCKSRLSRCMLRAASFQIPYAFSNFQRTQALEVTDGQ